ncbi:multicopper oxidase LPR1-like isoform X2 [Andrographis paniculata]|uniref:multicopper oxidase LPR1-like isoform X2 n=1 Tax=Andrographis paniculata TaxID=175694 RepID=UPI0021E6DE60|nr:multicopper oxidase LPR1-like isoform X2 [Andrographis paniculata]
MEKLLLVLLGRHRRGQGVMMNLILIWWWYNCLDCYNNNSNMMMMGLGVSGARLNDGGASGSSRLEMFVDDLPDMPRIRAFSHHQDVDVDVDGHRRVPVPIPLASPLRIGMYSKKWKFHRDLPPSPVFAYGRSRKAATVPGPTIEALHGVEARVTWANHLPPGSDHILPWDPTIPTAKPRKRTGIPTVVHLHGGIHEPQSDGHATSWFTPGFRERGPSWDRKTYSYNNLQQPGTLWYHDHAMGLTRLNLLAGLVGAYVIRHPSLELPLGLPEGRTFDRPLVVFDRSFCRNGSLFMNSTGNNPSIHPHWQPEYFGDVIVVNGKAWPRLAVQRRRHRFRIINASNARFFQFYLDDPGLEFVHVASDSAYIERPVAAKEFVLAPSEIVDVVIDFSKSKSKSGSVILRNRAPYPYPSGDPVNQANSKVLKFILSKGGQELDDKSKIPQQLIKYPSPDPSTASVTRYIGFFEYSSNTGEPTHMYINAKPFEAPATEMPKVGATEIWNVINLTEDNHPLHIHLGLLAALEQVELVDLESFKECMLKVNDAVRCRVKEHARGKKIQVPAQERGWKNVYKMMPGYLTKILVRFSHIHSNSSYTFDATAEPGYVYHCHVSKAS